jgi:hypothetical protein
MYIFVTWQSGETSVSRLLHALSGLGHVLDEGRSRNLRTHYNAYKHRTRTANASPE